MKTIIVAWLLSVGSIFAQNFAVLLAKDKPGSTAGLPSNWPVEIQPIGSSNVLPIGLASPWVVLSGEQLSALKADNAEAMNNYEAIVGTREQRKARIGEALKERVTSGQWEPDRLRLDSLQSELMGKQIQLQLLNCELLLLVTKAVAGTAATNNLTGPERARVGSLRNQLTFPQQLDFTQGDRDRAIAIKDELTKVYQLWVAARDLRQNISTNAAYVDPEQGWPSVTVGE